MPDRFKPEEQHRPWKGRAQNGGYGENPGKGNLPSSLSSTIAKLFSKAACACNKESLDWQWSYTSRWVRPMVAQARCSSVWLDREPARSR